MKAWKVQKFFADLIYDMRSRGLLPLAALLVVAMIAVPMYLSSQGSDPVTPVAAPAPDTAELAPENQAAVVAYEPGVRDYKERLSEQSEKDPFIQQFTVSEKATDSLEAATSGGGDSAATPAPDSGSTGGSTAPATGGSGGDKPVSSTRHYYFYETDVFVGEVGTELKRVNRVPRTSPLPSKEIPVLLYMGVAGDGKAAVFSVSRDVVGVGGEGFCSPSPESCQLLALEKGQQADVTYSFDNKVYTVKVADVRLRVTTKKPKSFGNR